jgi:hypothetical protein
MKQYIEFISEELTLAEIPFLAKCNFCETFSEKTKKNYCKSCYRQMIYSQPKNVYIISFAKFFEKLVKNKNGILWSLYDFECLERQIIELSDSNPALTYRADNFMLYIDCSLRHSLQECSVNELVKLLDEIYMLICKDLFLNSSQYFDIENTNLNLINNFLNSNSKNYIYFFGATDQKNNTNYIKNKLKSDLLEGMRFIY